LRFGLRDALYLAGFSRLRLSVLGLPLEIEGDPQGENQRSNSGEGHA